MQAKTQTSTEPLTNPAVEEKIQKLREIFADAPQMAKTALENKIRDLASHASEPRSQMESAGRTGSRQGKVSELTLILPFAPGGMIAAWIASRLSGLSGKTLIDRGSGFSP